MGNILGLDLGTNSIGWAVIQSNEEGKPCAIKAAGSRIIPLDAAVLGDFAKGNTKSQTAERTFYRSTRKMIERRKLRRQRLLRVLNVLGFLPEHFKSDIDFEKHLGQFINGQEPKIAWHKDETGQFTFMFKDSYNEMLADFAKNQPALLSDDKKIPYDWTIYYLRKKGLTQKLQNEELAWLLLHFNQKRGYYQLRDESLNDQADDPTKLVEYYKLKVVDVQQTDEKKGTATWYNVILENGMIYRRPSDTPLDWVGKEKEFIVTTPLEKDGTPKKDKDGNIRRSFSVPKENDWTLIKTRTENDIQSSGKTVGMFIYDSLLSNPSQKIIGKLVRTVERKFYVSELQKILSCQEKLNPALQDASLYAACINELYPRNEAHRNNIQNKDFVHLFVNDILFYQRPLKSKKSEIQDCPFETYQYIDKKTGEVLPTHPKCIAKSHPLYQEFRVWQFLSNLKIYQRENVVNGKTVFDEDVTNSMIPDAKRYEEVFEWLYSQKEVTQDALLKQLVGNKEYKKYRWNYVEDKVYPCNPTRHMIVSYFKKAEISQEKYLSLCDDEHITTLWHILYSIKDTKELEKALSKYAQKNDLPDTFVKTFLKVPAFKSEYGAYSYKALNKLLPLMRMGKRWDESSISVETRSRIDNLIDGVVDDKISERVRNLTVGMRSVDQFQGLPVWLATYLVYGRHSESSDNQKWNSPKDIDIYLNNFKQHSLRNPIVEQVVLETLRVVRDIWEKHGQIDEIHVEMGRELKSTNEQRAQATRRILENENTNIRIKMLLQEFINPEYQIENVRPYSPSQQDLLKIYEEGVLSDGTIEMPEDIENIFKKMNTAKVPTKTEFMRYKLWLEQKYRSPYTGEIIPLGKLFTSSYEIEHVIPQSLYFDDSFSNKVICESEVNKLKTNQLAYNFIKENHGRKVTLTYGKTVEIFSLADYEDFVKEHYSNNKAKMKKLLMDDLPDEFISRQLNDSRYISKLIKGLLSNIVREEIKEGELESEATSKNVITCVGSITDRLKKDWGMNDVWNQIVYPRFERLNRLTETDHFGKWENVEGKRIFRTTIPLEYQKGFSKKRIDHRHHAMDAIVIACASRNIVNYLNNESATKNAKISREDLKHMLCHKRKPDNQGNYQWVIDKPWSTFTEDSLRVISGIVVSFKQNLRIINKTMNYYQHYDAAGKKSIEKQSKGDNWAIRKQMHGETVFGRVNLRKIKEVKLSVAIADAKMLVDQALKSKVFELRKMHFTDKQIGVYFKDNLKAWPNLNINKVPVYYFTDDTKEPLAATRFANDLVSVFSGIKTADKALEKIEQITDTGIQQILRRHLEAKGNDPELAFSADGIDEMNANIVLLNNGKKHMPIYKVRKYETLGKKFNVGYVGAKTKKYVQAAKDTNLFFAVYADAEGKRSYETIPLNVVIEREKAGEKPAPAVNENGDNLLFCLSPGDLVYVPTKEEVESGFVHFEITANRLYKMVSSSGPQCFFIPYQVASPIIDKFEYSVLNKAEKSVDNLMIKSICVPVIYSRLGELVKR